jgi:hypothetical protein
MHRAYNLMYLYGLMSLFFCERRSWLFCVFLSIGEELQMLLISCSLEFTKESFVPLKSMVHHTVQIQHIRT